MHRAEGERSGAAAESLWWLCVLLTAVLCAGWSLVRVKPVILFAVGYGLAIAGVAWFLKGALQVSWVPRMRWGLFLIAGCGVWGAVGWTALWPERREWESQALARRLLAEFPRTGESEPGAWPVETTTPWSRRYARLGVPESYWPVLLLGEGLLAGGVAVVCLKWLVRPPCGSSPQQEGRR